jgi:hypothetical protein
MPRRGSSGVHCGIFKNVTELEGAVQQYLDRHNTDPKPSMETCVKAVD